MYFSACNYESVIFINLQCRDGKKPWSLLTQMLSGCIRTYCHKFLPKKNKERSREESSDTESLTSTDSYGSGSSRGSTTSSSSTNSLRAVEQIQWFKEGDNYSLGRLYIMVLYMSTGKGFNSIIAGFVTIPCEYFALLHECVKQSISHAGAII